MNPFDLAESVKTHLEAGSFSVPADYLVEVPQVDISDYEKCRVVILPGTDDIENADRSGSSDDLTIDIAIQKKLENTDIGQIKTLAGYVQELRAALERVNFTDSENVTWLQQSILIDPVFNFAHARENLLFSSSISIVYCTRP